MTERNMREWVRNPLEQESGSVWVLGERPDFSYSDGARAERYLRGVLSTATDLSADSDELAQSVKDWPSAYHLSPARAQLLRDLEYDGVKRVLEVGCGCGGVTRFLGEAFQEVVAVEGSLDRARLARLRTRDLANVSVVCAPFERLQFTTSFDLVVCVGVFEYAPAYLGTGDPFDEMLRLFVRALGPRGSAVVAIENQFGLKYFASSREDHSGLMFEGLEGYPRTGARARTFGYQELRAFLERRFRSVEFCFPYPDYKLPTCVLSERFMELASPAELVAHCASRDYAPSGWALFDEHLALLEIGRNGMLPHFANSFLALAARGENPGVRLSCLGVLYSGQRVSRLQTVTRFIEGGDADIRVEKSPLAGGRCVEAGRLRLHATSSSWVPQLSVRSRMLQRAKQRGMSLEELLEPCKPWVRGLEALARPLAEGLCLDGRHVDLSWSNSFVVAGHCVFVDNEWEWDAPVGLKVLVVRSISLFLDELSRMRDVNPVFVRGSRRRRICRIARALGLELTRQDFKRYVNVEAELYAVVFGANAARRRLSLRLTVAPAPLSLAANVVRAGRGVVRRAGQMAARLVQRIERLELQGLRGRRA